MQVSTTPLHSFCTSSISTSMNTVSVKETSNIQVVEIQDGHHLVNYNKIQFMNEFGETIEDSDN